MSSRKGRSKVVLDELSRTEPNAEGLVWSGRYKKDGVTPIMQKPRDQFKPREFNEENRFARKAIMFLRDVYGLEEKEVKVRADVFGEGRTVYFRLNGRTYQARSMEELRSALGLTRVIEPSRT